MIKKEDLLLSSYNFDLPSELIAQRPIDRINRDQSKLLIYNKQTNEIIDEIFSNIDKYLNKNSTLVFNQSKVFPSRLIGHKTTGGNAEVFLLEMPDDDEFTCEVLIKCRGKKKLGDIFILPSELTAKIVSINDNGTFKVKFSFFIDANYLNTFAKIPIPPYIRNGESDDEDLTDYQTMFAKNTGSVAAPTAGLHFTPNVFSKLKEKNIDNAFVTLHVGIGTFRPVNAENITEHQMHYESFFVDENNLNKIKNSSSLIPVGTTALRTLASIENIENFQENHLYQTNIFLYPGVKTPKISGLITNFHLPKSSLLMLVSNLIGREKTLELYNHAIKNKYRFFSYGDAMFIML